MRNLRHRIFLALVNLAKRFWPGDPLEKQARKQMHDELYLNDGKGRRHDTARRP